MIIAIKEKKPDKKHILYFKEEKHCISKDRNETFKMLTRKKKKRNHTKIS